MNQRLAIVFTTGLACFGCGGDNPMGPSQANLPPAAPAAPMAPVPKAAPSAAVVVSGPVLYDARDRGKLPTGLERDPKLTPEVEKLVFSALSPSYKSKLEDCQGAGDVMFHALASATGAFTAPATKQTAYLVASGPCAADSGGSIESTHLVVTDGDKVLAQASGKLKLAPGEAFPPFHGTDIRALLDVDGDGISEVLVTFESSVPAGTEEVARLFSAAGGAVKRVWSFAGVYKNPCGVTPTARVSAQVIHYTPGAKDPATRYAAEYFEAPCSASGAPKVTDFVGLKPAGPAAAPAAPAAAAAPPAAPPTTLAASPEPTPSSTPTPATTAPSPPAS
jgi:hypothetical protein